MYESANAKFDDMGCTWNAGHVILHDFFNVTWQTVDVRKARKIVMKREIVLNTIYKTHVKNVCIFDHEIKFGLKKLLNFCLIV